MRITTLVSASVVAIALAATIGSVSASDQFSTVNGVTAVAMSSAESVSASDQFATLDGVTAAPMASSELDAVKGMHDHWFTPNGDRHNSGQPPEGHKFHCERGEGCGVPSYHGICVAVDVGKLFGARPCP